MIREPGFDHNFIFVLSFLGFIFYMMASLLLFWALLADVWALKTFIYLALCITATYALANQLSQHSSVRRVVKAYLNKNVDNLSKK